MAAATFTKYHIFSQDLLRKEHNLLSDTFKVALTNTAPTVASDTVWNTTVAPAPAAANGYSSGGNTLTVTSVNQISGSTRWIVADSVFTASGGQIGPVRYAIIYNSTNSNKICGYLDFGASITLESGETYTLDLHATNGLIVV